MSDYNARAQAFLRDHGIRFECSRYPDAKCPRWCNGKHVHGDHYRVTLARDVAGDHRELRFSFWNSSADSLAGRSPLPYDVLSCISSDYYTPESFQDWCSEFGYDTDSRRALDTFSEVRAFAVKLQAFLSPAEAEALSTIQ